MAGEASKGETMAVGEKPEHSSAGDAVDMVLNIAMGALFFLTPRIPKRALYLWADGMGWVLFWMVPNYRRLVVSNLNLVYGGEYDKKKIEKIAVGVYRHQLKNVIDFARTSTMPDDRLRREIGLDDGEARMLREAAAEGRGVMLVSAHYGSFLTSAPRVAVEGFPLTLVYRQQSRSRIERRLRRLWEARGITLMTRGSGSGGAYDELMKSGGIFTTGIDQDAGEKGMFIPFLGRPASTFYGWLALALRNDSAIVPAICVRDPDGRNRVVIGPRHVVVRTGDPERDLRENLVRVNAYFEAYIRRDPVQWLWFHKRWNTKPSEK